MYRLIYDCRVCAYVKQNIDYRGKIIASKEWCFKRIEIFTGWFAKNKKREARGTNHEPGSGSAFINYYLSVNTVCGTFVRDLSHTRMQHVRDRDSNGILAIISHPFDTYHAHSQPPSQSHVYVRASTYSLAFGLIAGTASVVDTAGPADMNVHTCTYLCIPKTSAIVSHFAWTISCVFLAEIKQKD